MASLSGEKTLAELSVEFGVHPTMISNWKQELVKRAGELFARRSKAPAVEDAQKVIDDLHRKIGQLQVERDFLAGLEPLDAGARRDLYEILEERYGRRSTILTSQIPVDMAHLHRRPDLCRCDP